MEPNFAAARAKMRMHLLFFEAPVCGSATFRIPMLMFLGPCLSQGQGQLVP